MIANIKFDKLLSCFIWEKKSREMFMELYIKNRFLELLSQHTNTSYYWVSFVSMTSAMKIVNK